MNRLFSLPSGQSTQPSAHSSSTPPSASQSASFVTADQLAAISDKWAEQFARMEALLSRGNVFSTLVSAVKPVDTQPYITAAIFSTSFPSHQSGGGSGSC